MRRVVKKPSGVAIDLQKLINDKKTADVKLVVVDNNGRHEFHAHKLLLAARSKVFNEKFYGVGASSNVSELVLEEVADERVLTEFVHFLYTDTIEVVSDDTIKPLLALADKYDVPRLKIACGAFTAEKITNTNWMEILEFAAAQNEEDLVNDVVKYIGKNMRDESFDMIQLLSLKTPVFAAMLESDEFPLDELTIFGLANNWFEHNKTSVTEDEFRKVLRCVRFPMMDPLTLHTNVKGNPYVDIQDYMEALEYNALPKEFDSDLVDKSKRFHPRKGIAKFHWVNPHNTPNYIKLEGNDRIATKLSTSNWDLVLLSSIEMNRGQYYYEIEINNINNDKSGMVIGVTGDKHIAAGSYSLCQGLGMTGTPYNCSGGGYNTHTFGAGDVFGTLVDFDRDEIVFFKNGASVAKSSNPPSVLKTVYACVFLYYATDKVTLLSDKIRYPQKSLNRNLY